MRASISPGHRVSGETRVPGDKSIAHRWVILAATADGSSAIEGLPAALDVGSTASVMASLAPAAGESMARWHARVEVEGEGERVGEMPVLEVEGVRRDGLSHPRGELDCGNSGTTMRLVAGVVAASPFQTVLTGDGSLLRRPMERVAAPLRAMGAAVETRDGRPPLRVRGGELVGIRWRPETPSAQVKGAVLLAGLAAAGTTAVEEPAPTRDHTERVIGALGGSVIRDGATVSVDGFQHEGFQGTVPGDVSSAAFLLAAAALTRSRVAVHDVGLNPTRTPFVEVLRRMGVEVDTHEEREELGEPVGTIVVEPGDLRGTVVTAADLPLVIDEVPVLALVAANAEGESRFEGAGELRVKESDRLTALAEGIRELGGGATVEGHALVVGGGGLRGGATEARGDHRLAMAFTVGALAATSECEVGGIEWAAVSYPSFVRTLIAMGAEIRVAR